MPKRLQDKSILVLEDQGFIAMDISDTLADHGAVVIGPYPDLKTGLEVVQTNEIEGAILDVELVDGVVIPIAEQLSRAQIPYVFFTGSIGIARLSAETMAAPVVSKTKGVDAAIRALSQMYAANKKDDT